LEGGQQPKDLAKIDKCVAGEHNDSPVSILTGVSGSGTAFCAPVPLQDTLALLAQPALQSDGERAATLGAHGYALLRRQSLISRSMANNASMRTTALLGLAPG
jgi:hypothetical protein